MAADDIDTSVEKGVLYVEVRNLISKDYSKGQGLIDFQPLMFKLSIPLNPVTSKGKSSADKEQEKVYKTVRSKAFTVVAGIKQKVNAEAEKLFNDVASAWVADQKGDAGAYKKAAALVKTGEKRLEDMVAAGPQAVRQAAEREIKGDANFESKRLDSVGTWGFARSPGITLAAGQFQSISPDDNDANDELEKNIKAAKSAAGTSSPMQFVLASGTDPGLMIKKRITNTDIVDAKERRKGSGPIYFGTILMDRNKYVFELDKDCSKGTGDKLSRMVQKALKDATGKRYPIKVVGEGWSDEEDGDAD